MTNVKGDRIRLAAVQVLLAVAAGQTLDDAMAELDLAGGDRAIAQWLAFGALREALLLERLSSPLLQKPWRRRDADVQALLHLALFELRHGQRPAFAVVNDWVEMTAAIHKAWARGLMNAVLRRYLREREALEGRLRADDLDLGHPAWLAERLRAAYPRQWPEIAAANNAEAPLWLRINRRRVTVAAYQEALAARGLQAEAVDWDAGALLLRASVPVTELPGWREGWVSVQDGAAQQAALILAPRAGERILDACAAPGGKTAHLLEAGADHLLALDRSAVRLQRVAETLQRLDLHGADLRAADAAEPRRWWDGQPFDAILLDAPCTGTGVIRRHPDIRLRRQPTDVEQAVEEQRRLLEALWPCLKVGGRLLYATCSVLPEENAQQIAGFLGRHEDARRQEHPLTGQRLPGAGDMDGFYYALLEKRP